MTICNCIELLILILILLCGSFLKCRSKKKVADLEGNNGIVRKADCNAHTIGMN